MKKYRIRLLPTSSYDAVLRDHPYFFRQLYDYPFIDKQRIVLCPHRHEYRCLHPHCELPFALQFFVFPSAHSFWSAKICLSIRPDAFVIYNKDPNPLLVSRLPMRLLPPSAIDI